MAKVKYFTSYYRCPQCDCVHWQERKKVCRKCLACCRLPELLPPAVRGEERCLDCNPLYVRGEPRYRRLVRCVACSVEQGRRRQRMVESLLVAVAYRRRYELRIEWLVVAILTAIGAVAALTALSEIV